MLPASVRNAFRRASIRSSRVFGGFIRFSANASQGKGGTCFGDSGGPDLLAGTATVLAVNSYVTNGNCAGVGYGSRVDIPEVLDWIYMFLP